MSAPTPGRSLGKAVRLSRGMLIATAAMSASALVGVLLGAYLHEVSAASTVNFTPAEVQSPRVESAAPQIHATVRTKVITVIRTTERQVPVAIAEPEPQIATHAVAPVVETTTVEKTPTETTPKPSPSQLPSPHSSQQRATPQQCTDLLHCLLGS